jgi:hypothetical protein
MNLDPAVIKLLHLDPNNTSVSAAGGGGCSSASTFKILSKLHDGTQKLFFMKTGRGEEADIMFQGDGDSSFTCSGFATDANHQVNIPLSPLYTA